MLLFQSAFAAQIRLAWDPEPGVAGYKVYYGTASRAYGSPINVGNVTTYALTGLTPGQTYFIAVTAYDQFGESGYSGELNAVSLTASVSPAGAGAVNPSGVNWYGNGQSVSLSTTANSGYSFNGWSGDLSGSANPSSITMSGPKSVTANFLVVSGTTQIFTVATNPSGLQISVDGSTYRAPQSFTWVPGSSHTLSVPSPQSVASGVRYVYASWSDGGAQSHPITVPSSSATYTANFPTQYSLTTSVNPAGSGTVNPSGVTWYNSSQSASVSVTAKTGYTFNNWSGDLSGSISPSSVVMGGPKGVTANFLSTKTSITPKTISTPKTPRGPNKGTTGSTYKYFTGGSVSSQGDPVEYQFDWKGDGTDLSPWGSATESKTWTTAGTYQIRVRARYATQTNIVSSWSNAISVSVSRRPFIHVTSPNGGETYLPGTTHAISWDSRDLDPNGTVYLFYWYDRAWHPIAALPPTATSYNWAIPKIPTATSSISPRTFQWSTSLWIGNWVGDRWECRGSSGSFKILYDEWIFTISGGDKGGMAIQFGENTFGGYGISFECGMFEIEGTYGINADGTMSGTYTLHDLNSVTLESGNFSGGVNGAVTTMTLIFNKSNGDSLFDMSGVRLLGDQVIPVDWKANISGGVQGAFDFLKIEPYQISADIHSRVFKVSGSVSIPAGLMEMEGYFFLTNGNYFSRGSIAYGIYTINGAISEAGIFSGSLNPTLGIFKFSAVSDDGNKYTFTGQIGK